MCVCLGSGAWVRVGGVVRWGRRLVTSATWMGNSGSGVMQGLVGRVTNTEAIRYGGFSLCQHDLCCTIQACTVLDRG